MDHSGSGEERITSDERGVGESEFLRQGQALLHLLFLPIPFPFLPSFPRVAAAAAASSRTVATPRSAAAELGFLLGRDGRDEAGPEGEGEGDGGGRRAAREQQQRGLGAGDRGRGKGEMREWGRREREGHRARAAEAD